jgi:hypothetical protein
MTRHENPYPPPESTARPADDPAEAVDAELQAGDGSSEPNGRPQGEGLRRWLPRRRTRPREGEPAPAEAAAAAAETSAPGAGEPGERPHVEEAAPVTASATEGGPGRLRRRRKSLLDEREVAVYHLGGLAFELYRRDLLSEEVLNRRAGTIALIDETIHDIDVRLEQIEGERRDRRAHRAEAPTTAGNCLTCRAPFQADARFCWQCGARLIPADPERDEQVTQTIRTGS